jgi:hypothetical protein
MHQHKSEYDENQTGASTSPSGINQIQPEPRQSPTPDINENMEGQLVTIEGHISEFTFLLVLVGVLQFLAAFFQWRTARRSEKAAKESAIAASLSLKNDRPFLILERAELTGVLRGDEPIDQESVQLDELKGPPRFFPRVILTFLNYGRGPAILSEGLIQIDAVSELLRPRDFSNCKTMELQANAVSTDKEWSPLAEFNFEADWKMLFPAIADGSKTLIVYGCIRYTDLIGKDIFETGFCWRFVPPRFESWEMPKNVRELLEPYRDIDAPEMSSAISTKMPGVFVRGPMTHNYNT